MDDLIDRQAAIDVVRDVCDAIMSGCDSYYDPETDDEVYKDILEVDAILKCNKEIRIALKNMPSAQPNLQQTCNKLAKDINVPVKDCISRQAAIDKLDPLFESLAIDKIKALPSAQPETQWIPCSERLPEDEYVLISKLPTKISGSKWSVDIAIRTSDPRSRKIQWRDSGFGVIQDDKVLAWMPLPEPYTERREE